VRFGFGFSSADIEPLKGDPNQRKTHQRLLHFYYLNAFSFLAGMQIGLLDSRYGVAAEVEKWRFGAAGWLRALVH
jgi:hypothetical protein